MHLPNACAKLIDLTLCVVALWGRDISVWYVIMDLC